MTVALPLRKMGGISWLALESLRRQEGVDFNWELIIYEDNGESRGVLDKFIGKMPGCKKIIYKSIVPEIDGRQTGKFAGSVPLIDKWVGIAQEASSSSVGYVLQAGDVYSPKRMLKNHFENFKNKNCIYSTYPRGLFYHLGTKKKMFYDGYGLKNYGKDFLTIMHLNMAVRTSDIRRIRPNPTEKEKNRLIDKYIRVNIYKNRGVDPTKNKYIYNVDDIDSEDWATGFNTDGLNTISSRKLIYDDPEGWSRERKIKLWATYSKESLSSFKCPKFESVIPQNVIDFLNSIKEVRKGR